MSDQEQPVPFHSPVSPGELLDKGEVILIVDDYPEIVTLLQEFLQNQGLPRSLRGCCLRRVERRSEMHVPRAVLGRAFGKLGDRAVDRLVRAGFLDDRHVTDFLASHPEGPGLLAVFLTEGRGTARPRLCAGEMGRKLRFGVPSGLNWFLEFFAFMFFANVVVGGLGTTSLAALMAVIQVNSVSCMPAFALASAGAILVGQAIGAGARDLVPRLVRLTFLATGSWQVGVGLAYVAAPGLIFAPFARDPASAEALLAAGTRMLALTAAWQRFDAPVASLAESLRAAGDTAFTMWARLAVAWLLFVPGSWITVRHLGGGDLWAVGWIVAYQAVLAAVLLWRFRGGAWRRLELIEPTA